MDGKNESPLSVDEFIEYCRTQARLLSGNVETMGTEVDDLLDEIDTEIAEVRMRLKSQTDDVEGTAVPPSTDSPDKSGIDAATIEELEREFEENQALIKAKQARMQAFQELAADYIDLAKELQSDVDDGQAAVRRVVDFEINHDAPAYFEDRQTVSEAAAASHNSN